MSNLIMNEIILLHTKVLGILKNKVIGKNSDLIYKEKSLSYNFAFNYAERLGYQ